MKKNQFILGILAAASMSAVYGNAVTIEYTKQSEAAGLYDVEMELNAPNVRPYLVTAGATGGFSTYTDATFTNVSITNADITESLLEVQNSTINVTGGYVVYATPSSNGVGAVHGTRTLNISGGKVDYAVGGILMLQSSHTIPGGYFHTTGGVPVKTNELITINITGGTVFRLCGGATFDGKENLAYVEEKGLSAFAHGGDVIINVTGGHITDRVSGGGGGYGCVDGEVTIIFDDNAVFGKDNASQRKSNIYGGARDKGAYVGSTNVIISGNAEIHGDVFGGGSNGADAYDYSARSIVNKDTKVTISENARIFKDSNGNRGNVYGGGDMDIVKGNSLVVLEGGTIEGCVYASGYDNTTEGSATVQILGGDWSNAKIYGKTAGATVKGGTKLIVGAEGVTYNGELGSISGFDSVVVAKGSALNLQSGNIFDVTEHSYTITADNLGENGLAITTVSPDAEVSVDKPLTLNFATEGRVLSGRYKIIDATQADPANIDTTTNWDSEHVSVNGQGASFEGLVWDGQTLYLDYVSPVVDAAMAGNWGVFKASQAFTGTLWGNRANACVLSKPAAATDAKGVAITPVPTGVTLAWGTVYGQSARISGVGADYSLYGGAIGVERQFASGRSIGAALGYDWGEVSPFGGSKIDQESFHAAVYGRAGTWQVSSNSAVAVDWSAAYGDTTSENDVVSGDWSQDSLQLDARVSYLRKLNDRTTGSLFAGMQYFAADSDTVDGLEVSSMQNLRAEIGAGISYQLTQKATVYGEASVYNDLMRHNPYVADAGQHFKGTNPGRTGGSLNVGAQYDLNADWTVRGGYSFDVAEDSTEHNINAGAVYKF